MVTKLKKWKLSLVQVVPVVVCLLLLTAVFNIYVVTLDSKQLVEKRDKLEYEHHEQMWANIETVIDVTNTAARQNSRYLASRIETDLLRTYSDMDVLKRQFHSKEFSDTFYNVLKDNLETQNNNPSSIYRPSFYTLVGIEDGVISVFSNESVSTLSAHSKTDILDWASYAKSFPNTKLAEQAIKAVLEREDGIIFWQSTRSSDTSIQYGESIPTTMSMQSLRTVYDKHGLDGLNSISLVSPSYITENGDIFNTADRKFMVEAENYKLVIVQSFALSDILARYDRSLLLEQKNFDNQLEFLDSQIHYRYIEALMLGFVLFVISGILIAVYNRDCTLQNRRVKGD